jgi:hypothetical protein
MCTVLLPPGVNPIAVNEIYHIISYCVNICIVFFGLKSNTTAIFLGFSSNKQFTSHDGMRHDIGAG